LNKKREKVRKQMNIGEYLTPDYRMTKAEPAPSTPPGD